MEGKKKAEYIYPEESKLIIGAAYEVWNALGPGRAEKTYQAALEKEFSIRDLKFRRELPAEIYYKGEIIGRRRFDFLVEDKIVVELKVGRRFARADFEQVYDYLRINNYKLGILLLFNKDGVTFRRIPNLY